VASYNSTITFLRKSGCVSVSPGQPAPAQHSVVRGRWSAERPTAKGLATPNTWPRVWRPFPIHYALEACGTRGARDSGKARMLAGDRGLHKGEGKKFNFS
jgi:hypothetical protein